MDTALFVRRRLTATPLAREYARSLTRREPRRLIAIPWAKFDRARYPRPALDLAAAYHRRLASGEYLAVDTFARVMSALTGVGAPLDLITAAAQIACDEIRHVDHMLRMTALLSGEALDVVTSEVSASRMGERRRAYDGRPRTLEDLDLWMVEVPALGETFACMMLIDCCRRASDPVASAMLRSIVADEVHHARLGWYWLAWRSAQWSPAERRRVADRATQLVRDSPARFGGDGVDGPRGSRRALRALGILDTPSLQAAVERALDEEIVPGFDALGFGTSRARRRTETDPARGPAAAT